MSTIEASRVDTRWHVPAGALATRVLIAVAEPGADADALVTALTPARSSVLILSTVGHHPGSAVAATVEGLIRDGCPPAGLAVLGVGQVATIAPASCVLLRMRGSELPGAVGLAQGGDAVVFVPGSTPTESFVDLMASWPTRCWARGGDAGVTTAATEIDRLLSVGWS